MPFSPKPGTGRPVSGSSAARWKPGVTVSKRSLPAPSVQYAGPRPDVLRGARAKRCSPSFGPPDPEQLAALRVERDDVARDADLRVQHAVDHERRRLVARFGARAVVARVEAPRDLELARVARVDLRRAANSVATRGCRRRTAIRRSARRHAAARCGSGGGCGGGRLGLRTALGGRRASAQQSGDEKRQYDARRSRHGFPLTFSCTATLHWALERRGVGT